MQSYEQLTKNATYRFIFATKKSCITIRPIRRGRSCRGTGIFRNRWGGQHLLDLQALVGGQSRVDEEGRRPLATAHGDGLERERFNLFSGDNLLPNVGKIYQLRHNAVDVGYLTVAGFDILICVALPLVVYKG